MRFPMLLAALCAPAAAARGDVLVVGAGQQFATPQAAVVAANDGDTVLVQAGTYSGIAIRDKELQLVAEDGHAVVISEPIRVFLLAADKEVLIAGLTGVFEVRDNQGSVTLQDCVAPERAYVAPVGALVEGSSMVTLAGAPSTVATSRCRATRTTNSAAATPSSRAPSTIAVYTTELIGGDGADNPDSCFGGCLDGGDAGNGLVLESGSGAFVKDMQSRPGTPGMAWSACCFNGDPGHAIALGAGAIVHSSTSPPSILTAPLVVPRAGSVVHMTYAGQPGMPIFLLVSPTSSYRLFKPGVGALHLGAPLAVAPLGVVPASGSRVFAYGAPMLGAGVQSMRLNLQVNALGSGLRYLSNPVSLVALDAAF